MGKTYKSFEKHEAFDYHDSYEAKAHRKHKKALVQHDAIIHHDKKRELLEGLPDHHMGSEDWRDRD